MKRYSWSTDFMEWWDDGEYVLFSDHEAEVARAYDDAHCKVEAIYSAEVARLRAQLQMAAKAALDAVALSCEKERAADALRAEVGAYRKDAERYRWFRDQAGKDRSDDETWDPAQLDNEVDTAMGADA